MSNFFRRDLLSFRQNFSARERKNPRNLPLALEDRKTELMLIARLLSDATAEHSLTSGQLEQGRTRPDPYALT